MVRPELKSLREMLKQEVEHLQRRWLWIFIIGLLITLCGLFAVANLLATSVVSLLLIGTSFFVGGIFMLLFSFQVRKISRLFWSSLLSGILFLLASVLVMLNPGATLMAITLLTALFLGASGVMRVAAGVQTMGVPGWGWMVFSGLIGILAAILIAINFQLWALFLPGLLLGMDILFNGLSMTIFAWRLRP